MDGGVDASALEPRMERELVALLYPESALLFAWARRTLRDIAGEHADRFLVGRVEQGCWSVTHARDRWLTVHDGGHVAFDSARSAVAYAMAGVMLDAGVSVNSALLELGGIITRDRASGRSLWVLGETGRRLAERPREEAASRPGFRRSCVRLSALDGRPFLYFVCALEPPPEDAAFVTAHEAFELAAHAMLPGDFGVSKGEELPEGTVLDGHGGQDEVFLFTPDTPFSKRGLWGGPHQHIRKVYRMQRPLLVYPGFPVERETSSGTERRGEPADGGRGYYLVDSIADLIRSGHLVEISAENRTGE